MFSAVVINKGESGQSVALTQVDESQLPEGDVTIDVEYSTLNYKDGLAITGSSPVVRKFPMVPGIDLAGVVRESSHAGAPCSSGRLLQRAHRRPALGCAAHVPDENGKRGDAKRNQTGNQRNRLHR